MPGPADGESLEPEFSESLESDDEGLSSGVTALVILLPLLFICCCCLWVYFHRYYLTRVRRDNSDTDVEAPPRPRITLKSAGNAAVAAIRMGGGAADLRSANKSFKPSKQDYVSIRLDQSDSSGLFSERTSQPPPPEEEPEEDLDDMRSTEGIPRGGMSGIRYAELAPGSSTVGELRMDQRQVVELAEAEEEEDLELPRGGHPSRLVRAKKTNKQKLDRKKARVRQ